MDPPRGTKGGGAARWGPVLFWLRYYHMFWFVAWIREPRTSVVAATTITMAARIAAPENDPEPSSIASPNLLSLPHRHPPAADWRGANQTRQQLSVGEHF